MKHTRRNFLKTSGMFAGALLAAPQIVSAQTLGKGGGVAANSRINLAVLATGSRAGAVAPYFRDPRCAVTALCDPNRARILSFKNRICKEFDGLATQDFREVLARKDVDALYDNGFEMKFMDTRSCHKYMDAGEIPASKSGHGSMFIGEKGWLNVHRGGWAFSSDEIRKHARDEMKIKLKVSNNHQLNFIDAIQGKAETVSDLEAAVRSDIICHLSDIAIRTGREVKWDVQKETVTGDDQQIAMMKRDMRSGYGLDIKV